MVKTGAPKVLVLGLGEVGKPLYEIILESGGYEVYGYDVHSEKTIHKLDEIKKPIDIMHVCFPCVSKDEFIDSVVNYVFLFSPSLVIINSTVPVGTTEEIYAKTGVDIAHSPIRGVHVRMKRHLRFWTKYIGAINERASKKAVDHFRKIGLKVKILKSPKETELAKLFETVYRALLIAWWQEMHRISRRFNADILHIADFIADTHKVLGDRPVYYPDFIGGHCLIPNTKLLKECCNSKFLDLILESNIARRKEIENEEIRKDVERIKKLWMELIPKWYFGIEEQKE